ncbi:MAG: hypothetical protein V1770_01595 [bacterium]
MDNGIPIVNFWDLEHSFEPPQEGEGWEDYKEDWEEYQRLRKLDDKDGLCVRRYWDHQKDISFWGEDHITILSPSKELYKLAHEKEDGTKRFYFKDELYMPTTNFLLYSNNQFTEEYKNDIRRRIYDSVDVKIPNKKNEEKNELLSRKRIVEAMGIIRIMCEDNELLLQHNTEYGFFRNLIGGSVIALPFSLFFGFVFFYNGQTNSIAGNFLLGLASIFLILLIFSKHLIKEFGENYAHIYCECSLLNVKKLRNIFKKSKKLTAHLYGYVTQLRNGSVAVERKY